MSLESPTLAEALAQHQAGQVELALSMYRELLPQESSNADMLSLMGAACVQLGRLDEAADYLNQAIAIDPEHHGANDNLGVLLAKHDRFEEAVGCFKKAMVANPKNLTSLFNLASAQFKANQIDDTIVTFKKIVELDPDSLRAHSALAQNLKRRERFAEALQHYAEIVRLKPADFKARFELADAYMRAGRMEDSNREYREAVRMQPDSPEALVNLAHVCTERKQYDEAISLSRKAIALRPNFAEAHANLGAALARKKRRPEAIVSLEESVRLKPELAEAHNTLGIAQMDSGLFAECEPHFRRALALKESSGEYLHNLGLCLARQGRLEEAIDLYRQSLVKKPNFGDAHHNLSVALLAAGQFAEGFAEYEWRFHASEFPRFNNHWPLWAGGPIDGSTLVLCAEQGLGDTLQFVRYAPLVHSLWEHVILECPRALHKILAQTPGIDRLVNVDEKPPADRCVSLMSLPHLLGTDADNMPSDVPYLFTDAALVESWREELAQHQGFKVGIVWQGNPQCTTDEVRSVPLKHFASLAKVPGVRLVNLQKGFGYEQLAALAHELNAIDFGSSVDTASGPFMDTAAIMQNLDLVITSDTAAAHLAGGLGVPTWLAVNFAPDWRWQLTGTDCPWYPTMRIFRQPDWHDWPGVFRQMADELQALVGDA